MAKTRIRRPLVALVVLLAALVIGYAVRATRHDGSSPRSPGTSQTTATAQVALSSLPAQAAQTVELIKAGGPFPYPHNDGVVFHNNEHLLPAEPDGYYHEYTVPTPGADNRGARRIITGKGGQYFYTADHYEHFVRVDIDR